METLVVTADRNGSAKSFCQYLEGRGHNAQLLEYAELKSVAPRVTLGGAIFFDDGSRAAVEAAARLRESTRYLSLPLIVVSSSARTSSSASLLSVSANVVCASDTSNERILAELESRCESQPVKDELRQSLLGPFCNATTITFQEMAGTEIKVRSVYQKSGYKMFGDISAVIGLMTRTEGSLVLSFPEKTAVAVVKRILAGVVEDPGNDTIRDCVGEICNVIAGQARGILAETRYAFALSTPTIVSGAGHEIRNKTGMPCLVIAFSSDLGDFALQLCIGVSDPT